MPPLTAARRALSQTFFVAQRKAEDPLVEVDIRLADATTAPEATVDRWMKSGLA
jgi:hypothetical protein